MTALLLIAACLNAPDLSPVAIARVCDGPDVVLVADGCARLPIITPDGRRERTAALYLAATIRDITGVRPQVYVEMPTRPVTNAPALRLVRADDSDRFRVITKDGTVRFLGRSDFAVYDWCERVLGVRQYAENAKTFPRMRDLAVEPVDYADWPVFSYRDAGGTGGRLWRRFAKAGGAHPGGVSVHVPHAWFADPDVRTNHPNVFARQPDGSRGEMPLLCYGNPETLAYYEHRIDEHLAGRRDSGGLVDTRRRVISVSHWDVPLACTCAHCRRLFDPALGVTGSGSPVIWGRFLKNLATWACAAHPDYRVAFLPYLNVCDVPPGLDLTEQGNCEAVVCALPGLAMFKEPSVRTREEARLREWARVTGRKTISWHYECWPREYTSAPFLFGKTIAAHYRRTAPFVAGSVICGGGESAVRQLAAYVWMKCLWNPHVDVEALYDVFAERMFGPAAEPMRRLIALQEDGWARAWPWPHCTEDNVFGVSYRPSDTAEMRRLLSEAAERARGDARAVANLAWYAADFAKFFADEERYRRGVAPEPFEICRTAVAPVADGTLDEDCWRHAPARVFVPAFATTNLPKRVTRVQAVWTDLGVYFAFRCGEPDMAGLNLSAAYGELKKQDTLELFVDVSGGATGTCHRLLFDVRNRRVSTASDRAWAPKGIVSSVVRGRDGWVVEAYVPFSAFAGEVALPDKRKETRWRGNFARWHPSRTGECEWSRLSTQGSEWNQSRDAFCDWVFVDRATGN